MTTAQAPSTKVRPSVGARRFGYLVAIAVNAVMLWVAHRLLVWEWPGFLTEQFADVLPLITASLIASMVVNAAFLVRDHGRFRALGDLVNAAFGLAVSVRMWQVFPFDFTGYATDWSGLFRVAIGLGIAGLCIALVVHLVRLFTGGPAPDRSR